MTVCRDVGELDRRNARRYGKMMDFIKSAAYVNLIGQAGFSMIVILYHLGILG